MERKEEEMGSEGEPRMGKKKMVRKVRDGGRQGERDINKGRRAREGGEEKQEGSGRRKKKGDS